MRKRLALGMLFVFLLSFVCVIGTQSISAESTKAFSGEVSLIKAEDTNCVVEVKVANQGADFDGVVRLLFTGSGNESECAFDMQLALPKDGEKQYMLTIPASNVSQSRGNGILAFIDQDEKVLQTVPIKNVFQGKTTGFGVGILSDHFDRLGYMDLGGQTYYLQNSEKPVSLVEMDPEKLAEQLDGIYYLIIDQFDMSTLDKKSVEAIESWVDNGGWLIVGTGAYVEKTLGSFDSGFLGITWGDVSEPGEANDASIGMVNMDRYYFFKDCGINFENMAIAELKDSGYKSYETDSFPGLVFGKGNGCVTVLSFSLGEDEMQKASADVCRTIYDETMVYSSSMGIYSSMDEWSYLGQSALGVIDHLNTTVDFTWMKVLIIVYVILVGPILYLILRKAKRSEWYWVGVPALALAFIGVIFLFGQSMKVHDTRVYSVSVQRADGQEKQKVDTYFSAYHSGVKPWSIQLEDRYAYGGAGFGNYGMGVNSPEDYHYRVSYGDGISLGMKPQSNFETGYLYASGTANGCGKINAENLQFTEQTQSGSITNQTGYDLPYMFVISDEYFMAIKDVKANETVDLAQARKDKRIVNEQTAVYVDDIYYKLVDYYGYSKDEEDKDLLAALFIGMCSARQECQWGSGQVVVCGVVADSNQTVASKCFETSYGCLYTIAEQEVSNAAN